MEKSQMKITGITFLIISAICLFIAIERYSTNSDNVKAMNSFTNSSLLGGITGQTQLTPATPTATKYALFFAVISGIGGAVILMKSAAVQK